MSEQHGDQLVAWREALAGSVGLIKHGDQLGVPSMPGMPDAAGMFVQ